MYALAPRQGRIYRYKVTKARGKVAPTVRHAGHKDGFWGLKSLSLAARPYGTTYLIGTTKSGRLRLITIPDSSTFKLNIRTVRQSGWKHRDYLVVTGETCRYGHRLLTVNGDTGRANLYRFKIDNGAVRLDYRGRMDEPWPYRLTAPSYTWGQYPWTG
jgi:hypothetical protein